MMEAELTVLSETIRQAGARALDLARRGFEVQTKKDRSPVTTADLEVNRILHEMQRKRFPDDGWLSEESPDDPARLGKTRIWIVDPIDGTKAFVNRLPEFCISVALIEQDKPVLAAILNPSTDELFTALRGRGLSLNGKPMTPSPQLDAAPIVTVSPWEFRNGRWAGMDGLVQCRPMLSVANALALVAAGRVQATLTIEPENEWDLAAGVLLIEESGGTVADAAGRPFTFNQPTPRFHGVIAVSATATSKLQPLLQSHADRARHKKRES
jgi:myo-inositol-1(or 4)-monophosphatase